MNGTSAASTAAPHQQPNHTNSHSASPPIHTNNTRAATVSTLSPPIDYKSSRRPSLETSDSDDEDTGKYSRQNTLTNSPGGNNAAGTAASAPASGSKKKLNRKERRAAKTKHRKINKQHPEFELTYDMMLGIRTVVGNNPTDHSLTTPTPATSANASNAKKTQQDLLSQSMSMKFPGQGSSRTPAHAMRDFKFKDYQGDLFRKIRQRFQIDPTEYLLCVCGNFQYLEFISNSKSGQFFFYSHDRQYMIKTISGAECKFLREILPSYLEHINSNPNTLLTRFYGMHRVRPHKKREVHFLIMGSVFYTSKFVHTVFDLKGSRQGRNATAKEKASGAAVYKDNDFLEMGITIKLGAERAKLLNEQIARDVEYLRKLNIMDYSLLLGIHYKDRAGADLYGPTDNSLTKPLHDAPLGTHAHQQQQVVNSDKAKSYEGGEEPTQLHMDDKGGIYTQLHPRTGAPATHEEMSQLDPHSQHHYRGQDFSALATPTHRVEPDATHGAQHGVTPRHTRSPSSLQLPANVAQTIVNSAYGPPQPAVTIALPMPSSTQTTPLEIDHSNPPSPIDGEAPVVRFHYEFDEEDDTTVPATPRKALTPTGAGPGDAASQQPNGIYRLSATSPPARTIRSQSVMPISIHSPTTLHGGSTAALLDAAAMKTKKQLEAAAKAEAVAKQTAYGLPKKYNKVSKPGDIAFSFEFDADGAVVGSGGNPTDPGSLPVSPAAGAGTTVAAGAGSGNAGVTNSPRLAAAVAGPHTAFDSLNPPALNAGRRSAGNTPTLEPISENTSNSSPTHQQPTELQLPSTSASSSSHQVVPPRALSVFASAKEAQSQREQLERGRAGSAEQFTTSLFATTAAANATSSAPASTASGTPATTTAAHPGSVSPPLALSLPANSSASAHTAITRSSPRLTAISPPPVLPNELALHLGEEHKSSSTTVLPAHTGAASTTSSATTSPISPDKAPADKLGLFATDGGCAGLNSDGSSSSEIYFMGIIDILQLYNLGKKSENFFKSLKYHEDDISAVNPTKYAERFKNFISAALR